MKADTILILFYSFLPFLHSIIVWKEFNFEAAIPFIAYSLVVPNSTINFLMLNSMLYLSSLSIHILIFNILIVSFYAIIEYKYPFKIRNIILTEFLNYLEYKLDIYLKELQILELNKYTKSKDIKLSNILEKDYDEKKKNKIIDINEDTVDEKKNSINMTKIFESPKVHKPTSDNFNQQKEIFNNMKKSYCACPMNNTLDQQKEIFDNMKKQLCEPEFDCRPEKETEDKPIIRIETEDK